MNTARSFRSIFMVASCAAAALGCYMVSLRVASERAALEEVENRIVLAQRDMRVLQTEIGTRGRLAQLERWNVRVLALSAPSADQFLNGGFELAKLARPQDKVQIEAPVVLASAPAETARAPVGQPEVGDDADAPPPTSSLLHTASLKLPEGEVAKQQPESKPAVKNIASKPEPKKAAAAAKAADTKSKTVASAAKPEPKKAVAESKSTAKKSTEKTVAHVAAKVTSQAKTAKADPLAPLAVSNARKGHKDIVAAR